MSIQTKKTWFVNGEFVEQVIPESEIYKQEPVAWHTEDHLTDRSATTYSKDMAYRWECKGWPVTPLYTSPPKPDQYMKVEGPLHVVCQCDKCKA